MQVMNVDRLLFLHLIFFYIILITGTMVGSNCPGFPHTRDQPCMARNSTMGKQQSKLVSARHCPDVETWERVAYPRERYESFTDRTLKNTSGQPISLCAHNAHAQPEYVNSSQYGRGKCEFLKKRGGILSLLTQMQTVRPMRVVKKLTDQSVLFRSPDGLKQLQCCLFGPGKWENPARYCNTILLICIFNF